MNAHAHIESSALLRIAGGIRSVEKALALKAALEDLPGVHLAEITTDAVHLHFAPELVGEMQFFEAVKQAGFQATYFAVLPADC